MRDGEDERADGVRSARGALAYVMVPSTGTFTERTSTAGWRYPVTCFDGARCRRSPDLASHFPVDSLPEGHLPPDWTVEACEGRGTEAQCVRAPDGDNVGVKIVKLGYVDGAVQ